MTTPLARLLAGSHRHPLLTAVVGVLAQVAVTSALAVADSEPVGVPGALGVLIAVLAALAAGPLVGCLVALAGWAYFVPLIADYEPESLLALPVWLAAAFLAGWIAREMRRSDDERSRLLGEREVERVKSDFISTASHELRTPLAAIYGAALTLKRPTPRLDDEDRARLVEMIASEATRLVQTVNEVVLADRLEQGRLSVEPEELDPLAVAETAVAAQRVRLPDGVTLRISAAEPLPRILADRAKLVEVLANLLDNAIKYSNERGEIELALERRGDSVRFSVRDTGIGIPADQRDRIFDRFYRVDPQMTRGIGATGLGLYIYRELVARMGGRIWFEPAEGEGSRFTFELPVARGSAGASEVYEPHAGTLAP